MVIRCVVLIGLLIPTLASTQTQFLPRGWSMVGNDSTNSMDVISVFGNATSPSSISSSVTSVWSWNNILGRWNFFAPSLSAQELTTYANSKGYGVLSDIAKGEGFWVNANNPFLFDPRIAAPIANAGVAQNVAIGSLVTLDGSASSDPNNRTLTYAWSFTSVPVGSSPVLSSPTAARPTFSVALGTTYVLSLIVNNGRLNSAPATVTISTITPIFSANCASCHVTQAASAHIALNGGYVRGSCTLCHGETRAIFHHMYAMNPATRAVCGSCHTGIDFATGTGTTIRGIVTGHIGGARSNDQTCSLCHDAANNTATHNWSN